MLSRARRPPIDAASDGRLARHVMEMAGQASFGRQRFVVIGGG
ncbi:MAG: hypothetical protein AAFV53_13485 [Myxococcota bacterium]